MAISKTGDTTTQVKNTNTTGTSKPTGNTNPEQTIYDEMKTWQNAHEENLKTAAEKAQAGDTDAFDTYQQKLEEIGADFDFMEGKDPKNEEEYDEQLTKLAEGEFQQKDANGDGVVSFEEYINDELASLDETDSEETKVLTKVYSYLMASVMDQGMGNSNNDGVLNVDEFKSFYKNLDRFNGEGFEEGDGVITTDGFNMPSYIIEQIFSDETIDSVIELVLKGEI